MAEFDNNKEIDNLLKLIERQLNKYEKYPEIIDIKQLIKDRINNESEVINCRKNILNKIREHRNEYLNLKNNYSDKKENIYDKELLPDIISILLLYANKTEETERQIMRSSYCLYSNNQIFRILDMIYNNNYSQLNESKVQENAHITKINIAMFLINYTFEKLLLNTKESIINSLIELGNNPDISIFKSLDIITKETIINKLLIDIPDVQILGDILGELKCFDEYSELTKILKRKDSSFNRKTPSKLRVIRNSSSHGEFYPNLEKISDIKLIIDNNGVERETLSYFDIIDYTNKSISLIPNTDEISTFITLFHSNNLPIDIEKLSETTETKNKLIETLCILSLYNIIQYNNEKHFRDKLELNPSLNKIVKIDSELGENYLEKNSLNYYFQTSFKPENNDDILQTIKYAISHINYSFDGEKFTFINPQNPNKQCSCNIGRIILFIADDDVYRLSSSTSYYEKISKLRNKIVNNYIHGNYILNLKENKLDEDINNYDNINKLY